MKKTTKVGRHNRLFETFVGERVRVFTKQVLTESLSSEEGTASQNSPLALEGYLLDMDDVYIYLGMDADKVSAAVSVSQIVAVQEVGLPDILSELLDGADTDKVN